MTSPRSNELMLDLADAWGLAAVLRHRAPCAPDCEYCSNTGGDQVYIGYKLAAKVQRALLQLMEQYEGPMSRGKTTIEISEKEAWMIYRYLPSTSYSGARDLLLRVFETIASYTETDMPSWMRDVDLDLN